MRELNFCVTFTDVGTRFEGTVLHSLSVRYSAMTVHVPPPRHIIVAGLLGFKTIAPCWATDRRPESGIQASGTFSEATFEECETPGEALQRELREELGIDVPHPGEEYLTRIVTDEIDLTVWLISSRPGIPINSSPIEHDQIAWFESSQMTSIDLALPIYETMITNALGRASSSAH